MCFKSKKNEDLVEKLRLEIISGERKVNSIDFMQKDQAEALLKALGDRKDLAKEIDVEARGAKSFLTKWIGKRYNNFLYLKRAQYFEDVASLYVYGKIKETLPKSDCETRFQILKSFDEKPVINFIHQTYEGEEIAYFDAEIRMPVEIECSVTVRFKIDDALLFLNELDIAVPLITAELVADYLDRKVQKFFRQSFAKRIVDPAVGCYHLPEYIEPIADDLRASFGKLSEFGLSLNLLNVNNIKIPNNMNELMEEQYYVTLKKDSEFRIEKKEAELALEHYERKASIHDKYQNFEPTLTEAEKDLALKRYLIKNGLYREERVALKHDRLEKKTGLKVPNNPNLQRTRPIAKIAQIVGKKKKLPLITYGVFAAAIFISLCLLAASAVTGWVMLGLTLLIGGIVIFRMWKKLKDAKEYNKNLKNDALRPEKRYANVDENDESAMFEADYVDDGTELSAEPTAAKEE